ncbi:hypothetical protein NUACC26_037810 [Scytonema sp. NUACC26]
MLGVTAGDTIGSVYEIIYFLVLLDNANSKQN